MTDPNIVYVGDEVRHFDDKPESVTWGGKATISTDRSDEDIFRFFTTPDGRPVDGFGGARVEFDPPGALIGRDGGVFLDCVDNAGDALHCAVKLYGPWIEEPTRADLKRRGAAMTGPRTSWGETFARDLAAYLGAHSDEAVICQYRPKGDTPAERALDRQLERAEIARVRHRRKLDATLDRLLAPQVPSQRSIYEAYQHDLAAQWRAIMRRAWKSKAGGDQEAPPDKKKGE